MTPSRSPATLVNEANEAKCSLPMQMDENDDDADAVIGTWNGAALLDLGPMLYDWNWDKMCTEKSATATKGIDDPGGTSVKNRCSDEVKPDCNPPQTAKQKQARRAKKEMKIVRDAQMLCRIRTKAGNSSLTPNDQKVIDLAKIEEMEHFNWDDEMDK